MPVWADEYVLTVLAVTAFSGAGALGIGAYFWGQRGRRSEGGYEPTVIAEWRSTGQIDFVGADDVMRDETEDKPAQFMLLMQEQRQVANIAGGPTTETRWRYATKGEAKDVVRRVMVSRQSSISGLPLTPGLPLTIAGAA